MPKPEQEKEKLRAAIAGLEAQRAVLGDSVVDSALAALREQLSQTETELPGAAADERKNVTIVFVDVTGFTALSEKLGPEDVRSLINACFDCLVPVVQKYEGTIDKFIGDEIMALFGAPIAHEDDPERALRTALEMMVEIEGFNRVHNTNLGLHMGVNTGPVIAGRVGTASRQDYSVMGDAVNLAARLEDASSTGEIFVGLNTYRRTVALFDFEALPPMHLKGKEEPVEVHRLIGLRSAPKRGRGIEGLQARLTGRETEFAELRQALTNLQNGQGAVLSILGEAGLGKSRLIAEVRASLDGKAMWAEGRALSYTVGRSYWLARDIIFNLLELNSAGSPSEVGAAFRNRLEQQLGEGFVDVYPYLARVFELPMDQAMQERVMFLSGEALQRRILQAFHDYIRARAMVRPLVLVWEDVHWCDPSSARVLEEIIPLVACVPLLLLCPARPNEDRVEKLLARAAELVPERNRTIELRPLSRDQSDALVLELLKIDNLPDNMRDLILDRAEGNPFFIEELLRSLLDAGIVVVETEVAATTRELQPIDIPDTLEGVLSARIDRLTPANKSVLQKASVIGRVFQQVVLARLDQSKSASTPDLVPCLDELRRREFIRSREHAISETPEPSAAEFIFKHAITHDVSYGSLLLARRKKLHLQVAEALEAIFPERRDELSATLGYHFERAGVAAKAADYLGIAAERAHATFANTEALAFYRSAIAQIETLGLEESDPAIRNRLAQLCEGLGDVLTLTGQHSDARIAYKQARSRLADADCVRRSRLYRKTGFSYSMQRHYGETGLAYDEADKELGALSHPTAEWWEEKVQIQLERMHLFYWQGMAAEMRELAERFRKAVEENGSPIQRGKFFAMLALSYLTGSRYRPSEECLRLAELSVSKSEGSTNLSEAAHVRFCLGFVHLWRGNFAQAVEHLDAALSLARRVGDLVIQARCLTYLSVAHRCAGNVDLTRINAAQTIDLTTKIGMLEYVAMGKANLSWVAWREGDCNEAEKLGREALNVWHGMEDPYSFDWIALWQLIAIALERGDLARAIDDVRALLDENQHPQPEKLVGILEEAAANWEKKQVDLTRASLERAVKAAGECGRL